MEQVSVLRSIKNIKSFKSESLTEAENFLGLKILLFVSSIIKLKLL